MVTRINGFSNSGIDIDTTVSKLMKAARIPMDKLKQQKQSLEWQRDDYRSMNNKVMDFRNLAFNMKLQSSYQTKKSVSADDTTVSVSASAIAPEGIYTVKVNKLATSASVTSGALGATTTGGATALSALSTFTATTLTIGGEKGAATIQVKPTDTIDGFVAAVNSKTNTTGVTVSYDKAMDRFFFVSNTTGGNAEINLRTNDSQNLISTVLKLPTTVPANYSKIINDGLTVTGSKAFASGSTTLVDSTITPTQKLGIQVGTTTAFFDVSNTTTIGKLVDAINSSDIGKKERVSAYIDSNNKLAFFNPHGPAVTTNAADPRSIKFTDQTPDSVDLLNKLGLDVPTIPASKTDYYQYQVKGTQADIEFNGAPAKYDSNTFSINGMTITAKKEGGPAVNITNTRDVDAVYNSIKTFVDKYNELINTVNTKIDEKRYRDFQPLTDDQRKNFKDDQIKTWEDKAKSGLLHSDAILSRGLMNFRGSFSNSLEGLPTGNVKSLAEIGISTSLVSGTAISGSYLDKGKIYIDDVKLKKAIAEKPDEVMALFNSNDGLKDTDKGDGLATRLYDKANALIDQITAKAGTTSSVDTSYLMGKSSKDIDNRINNMTTKLDALETRYYKQFTAMEKYISQMQAQSSQLTSQLGK